MRHFSPSIVLVLSALMFVSLGSAQQTSNTAIPNLIRYGGMLQDASGSPIATTTGVTFAIYQQQDGGAAIWLETQNVTTDAAGNYSVLLGSTTATGLPSDLFSQQEQRWLGVQMQGQAEQPRVLLVSVPYAFKAHEAETLAGKSISDFVLVKDSNSASAASGANSPSQPGFSAGDSSAKEESGKLAASQGPTNFSGSTTDQIVGVTQTGTGVALSASAASSTGILGVANSSSGAGVLGRSDAAGGTGIYGYAGSTTGASVGLSGGAASSQGTAIYALESATNGGTVGLEARVQSPAGVAALIENLGGGMLISTMTSTGTPFTVDGLGNVHAAGMFTGSGAGLTSLNASNLSSGTLPSARLSGTYSNALTLSSTSNVFYGDGSHLMGVMSQPGPGSTFYIQNGTTQQASANFNISGNGTLGGTLAAKTLNASNPYQIGGSTVLSTVGTDNAFLGLGAGASNSSGSDDTFSGNKAGFTNRTGQWNSFYGSSAGRLNTSGNKNTFSGYAAGYSNSSASNNTSIGYKAGYSSTSGDDNTFLGWAAGYSNTTGANNTFLGLSAGYNNTTGGHNIYIANRGPASGTESSAIRIGDPAVQTTAYIAGIYNAQASSGLPVFVNANGQLGTSGSGTGIVTSFNGRMNAVVPQTGDYSFSMIRSTLGATQLSGTYSQPLSLTNTSNVYYGNGSNLTGIVPGGGSTFYIQNGTTQQASANFNISGNGTLGGTLAAKTLNASNPYQIGGSTVLSTAGTDNAFLGLGAGASNSSGSDDTFSGNKAGFTNSTGQWNSFYGSSAGRLNTSGNKNTFSGYAAGYSNSSASNNTSIGYKAGYSSTSGSDNTFLGWAAGYSNTTGANNTFLGLSAGYNNTTGSHDIYLGNQGPPSGSESNAIRIGDPAVQTTASLAGIYGATTNSGSVVFVDSTGKLGTSGGAGIVTSFNGRSGAVLPTAGDYSFSMISGTLGSSQLTGTYSQRLTLSNTSNSFTGSFAGNGSGLMGVLPAGGSPYYIQNGTGLQTGTNFNIDGNGSVGGTLQANVVNTANNVNAGGNVNAELTLIAQQGVFGSSSSSGFQNLISENNGSKQTLQLQNFASPIGGFTEAQFDVNGTATFYTDAFGDTTATGTKSAAVPLEDGKMVKVFSMESPEVWFEDFGSGQLLGGITTITLDASFAQTVNTANGYHVFLTPKGDCKGLYVTNETNDSFEVRELSGGQSSVAFDYRIVAHRKGFDKMRLPVATMPKPEVAVHPERQK